MKMLFVLVLVNILLIASSHVDCKHEEYDYIVVGSGSSGGVIGPRLAEDEDIKVLHLEAGGEPSFNSTVPLLAYHAMRTEVDWMFQSVPQNKCCSIYKDGILTMNRGKMLGGTSSMNYMIYTRGHTRDYDHWKDLGNDGWGFSDLLPYFLKLEDYQTETTPETAPWHHQGGPITVSSPTFKSDMIGAFLKAGEELGYETIDYNTNKSTGFMHNPFNIRKGVRCATYVCYMKPAIKKYKNYKVISHALATKLIIDDKKVTGVEYEKDGVVHVAKVKGEVILSAGVFGNPQLLMLSGIGPEEELNKHEIPVVLDLPGIGQNLQDHAVAASQIFKVKVNGSTLNSVRYETEEYLDQWKKDGTGPMSVAVGGEGLAFFESSLNPEDEKDWPDLEIYMISDNVYKVLKGFMQQQYLDLIPPPEQDCVTLLPLLLRPKSNGTVTLRSKDPHDPPVIDPNYLANDFDVKVLVEGIRMAHKLANTKAFQAYGLYQDPGAWPDCKEEYTQSEQAYLECVVRSTFTTGYHYSSTCMMGTKSNKMAVVNNELRLYGMKNLRVADASIMPAVIAAHPNVPSMMIGEKAADMIKEYRKKHGFEFDVV